jgi:PPIC-type peptidyl-prolyl cis-trans isomerase-like protein
MQRKRCVEFQAVLLLASSLALIVPGCGTRPSSDDTAQGDSPQGLGATPLLNSKGEGRASEGARPAPSAAIADELAEPYPRGRWRLASPDELSRVMFWFSHLLIRHRDVRAGVVSFDMGDWTPAPPVPARTRREAFALASTIQAQLTKNPESFARVARELSEDVATSERGGSLGGVSAFDLTVQHGDVLDMLAVLKPGEISRVVETPYGFHVFRRRTPPEPAVVSGRRIVIGYDQAPWLKAFLARREVARSRAEALDLARSVYARARAGESFAQLIEEYSDHTEALRQGDFGQWSTHEHTPFPLELEVLSALEVGEVAPPLDSPFGVQIIERTPNRERATYAMSTVQQSFELLQPPSHPASRSSVMHNLQRLAGEVAGDPMRFDALQASYCCADVEQWPEGRGPAAAEQALRELGIGQVSARPVALPVAFALVKRMPPRTEPTLPVLFELPVPPAPDVRELARSAQVNYALPGLARKTSAKIGLEGQAAQQFIALHDSEATNEAATEDQRVARFDQLLASVAALLGEERYALYRRALGEYFEQRLLAVYDRSWRKSRPQ